MTSFAFIMGVVPLVLSSGPAPRCAMPWAWRCSPDARGDLLRLLLTPVFYLVIRASSRSAKRAKRYSEARA